jgi:hypothetical protein
MVKQSHTSPRMTRAGCWRRSRRIEISRTGKTGRNGVPGRSPLRHRNFLSVSLEPEHDLNRFKVGSLNLNERLRQLRCSAAYAQVVKTWPCRRLWEKTAIECVTEGCERLRTEVFRALSLETVEERCRQFFALMPQLPGGQSK